MAEEILRRVRVTSAVVPNVDDDRITPRQKAHCILECCCALRTDPHESVVVQITYIAGQEAKLGYSVVRESNLPFEGAWIRCRFVLAGGNDRCLLRVKAETEVFIAADALQILID